MSDKSAGVLPENREVCRGRALWWADRSHCVTFAVALSSNGREALQHAQREESVGFLHEIQSSFHTCRCRGKLEYLWLSTEAGGQEVFPFLDVASCVCDNDVFLLCCPFLAASLSLQFLWAEACLQRSHLALSQPGDAPGAGRKCHFGVHHGNHKQSPSLGSACRVHSGLWLYLVFSISGLRIQLSPAAFQLLSWKYEIFIWGQKTSGWIQQNCGCQIHQL